MICIVIFFIIDVVFEVVCLLFEVVNKQIGFVFNFFCLVVNSLVVLEGYFGMFGVLAKGWLLVQMCECIVLVVVQINVCGYCLVVYSFMVSKFVKLDDVEIVVNCGGCFCDVKVDVVVCFVVSVVIQCGYVVDVEVVVVCVVGYDDVQIVEIVQYVVLNIWINYINEVVQIVFDFFVVVLFVV